ncbi:Cold shock domain-containing protein E1, partial [Operophtera brumata]
MSNNPQWKMFQPPESHSSPLHDILDLQPSNMQAKQAYRNGSGNRFSIGTFNMDGCPMGDSTYSSSSTNNSSQYDSMNHPPIRETGIIEKLLHSYGFIQCCERQARLFFHFSQFSGNTEHLKIGDPVEFEMTYDRRTGKPIASTVTKIAPEDLETILGESLMRIEASASSYRTQKTMSKAMLYYTPVTPGTLGACHVRFENPQSPVKYHGVICSMKENFGFIERADVVKEIFFHFSEAKTKEELVLGDDVEFIIQTRNGKEVACNITKLPCGSVVFEDVSPETMRGQVLKPLERGSAVRVPQTDPLPGRIRYRALDHSEVEVPFGDKDQCGEFTLRHGDWVQFQVATDRRDQLKRATNISLLDESFNVSGERSCVEREQGMSFRFSEVLRLGRELSVGDEGFKCVEREQGMSFRFSEVLRLGRELSGFKCVEREQGMSFRFSEVLRLGRELSVGDEVEFTVEPVSTFNMNNRQSAIRVKHVPPGTVKFETLVERAAKKGADSKQPRVGDMVTFDIYQVKRTKELIAVSVQLQHGTQNGVVANGVSRAVQQGFIAALKDGFGFIETSDHNKEVFFHF